MPDPEYDEKMGLITKALSLASEKHPVVYEDEVDIHFNPKIGADWYFKGQQKRIITPNTTLLALLTFKQITFSIREVQRKIHSYLLKC